MKKITLFTVLVACTMIFAGTAAFAEGIEADFSLAYATAPDSAVDSAIGFTIGAGMMMPNVDKNFQARVDLSMFSFDSATSGVDFKYERTPITISGRYYFPRSGFKAYGQGGLEYSMDKVTVTIPSFSFFGGTVGGGTSTASETRTGLMLGGGVEYDINQNLKFVADARYHAVTDAYMTLQAGVAYGF